MKFKRLADYLAKLEQTNSRLAITEILAALFDQADGQEVAPICYLSQGRLGPRFANTEFNLAEKLMVRVLAKAYGQEEKEIRKAYQQKGDLGDLVQLYDQQEKSKPLSVSQVYQQLEIIAQEGGGGSVERKINQLASLLSGLESQSAKFVVRITLGKLRLGFSDLTILDALSWLVAGNKSKREVVEEAYNIRADAGYIAQVVKEKGLQGLEKLTVSLGVPVMPALCQRLGTTEEIITKMAPRQAFAPSSGRGVQEEAMVAVEPKYDGARLQIHFGSQQTVIFTRNLENVAAMFPDLVAALGKELKAKSVILDGEAIGYDPQTSRFLPFQETIKRKRKYEVGATSKEIPLKYFCFDILFYNGQSWLKKPFRQRRRLLEQVLPKSNQTIMLSPQIVTADPERLRCYHDEQIAKGLEGVVIKKWSAPYEPGRRGFTWVKLKSEKGKKGAGLTDTLDCVVMGYYHGRGKRAAFGIGAFLVGARHGQEFLTVSKIGTGLTDNQWREMKRRCRGTELIKMPRNYQVDKNLFPDVWCEPKIVVEIEADNITRSPIHTAQYALRFPRLIRFRDDKDAFQATSLAELKKLYELQK